MPHFVRDVEEIRQRAMRKIDDGAVTATYGLDKDKTVQILNEALATEIVCVLRYMHHYFMATGVHGKAAAGEFKEHADAEREHADDIAERIQQLGGKPDFNPRSLLERSVSQYVEGETLADMIREDLIAERIVIDVYRKMIKHFGDKDPTTRVMIEHILQEEEEHASDLSDLLYVVNPSTGETEVQDPGTEIGKNLVEEEEDLGTVRGKSKVEQRAAAGRRDREQPSVGKKGVKPAHEPGTTGRVMARRGRNNLRPDDNDIAVGGQSGSTRSPRVLEKNRKKRAA
jgi:bacterioferritin